MMIDRRDSEGRQFSRRLTLIDTDHNKRERLVVLLSVCICENLRLILRPPTNQDSTQIYLTVSEERISLRLFLFL